MSKELQVSLGITGLTVTAKLYLNGVIANGGNAVSCAEYAGQGGLYQGDMPAIAAGEYFVQFFSAGIVQSAGVIDWNGTSQITLQTLSAQITTTIAGTGPNAIAITIKDGSNVALQNAVVAIVSNNIVVAQWVTNASGVAPVGISLPNGTYTVNVYCPGYTSSSTTIVVASATYTSTINLAIISVTPGTPPFVTGYLVCLDSNNSPVGDIDHTITFVAMPDGSAGNSLDPEYVVVPSVAGTGLVQYTRHIIGAIYQIRRGSGDWKQYVAPATTFLLPDCNS